MVTKHFLRTLVIFMAMIIIGLIGVFAVSYFNKGDSGGDTQGVSSTGSTVSTVVK